MNRRVFTHPGDCGDGIAALPVIRQMGGGKLVFVRGKCRETMDGHRTNIIRPLMEALPYITACEWGEGVPARAHDFSEFRTGHIQGESLAHWQARHLGIDHLDVSPWLTVNKNVEHLNAVVFARSPRYHNGFFPWFALVKRYPDAVFVGIPAEHAAFQKEFSCKIRYVPTNDLLELASVIASARLFCGNQSAPFWIAIGLGVTTFQETWTHDPNSIIERPNAFYMTEPEFELERLPL